MSFVEVVEVLDVSAVGVSAVGALDVSAVGVANGATVGVVGSDITFVGASLAGALASAVGVATVGVL